MVGKFSLLFSSSVVLRIALLAHKSASKFRGNLRYLKDRPYLSLWWSCSSKLPFVFLIISQKQKVMIRLHLPICSTMKLSQETNNIRTPLTNLKCSTQQKILKCSVVRISLAKFRDVNMDMKWVMDNGEHIKVIATPRQKISNQLLSRWEIKSGVI